MISSAPHLRRTLHTPAAWMMMRAQTEILFSRWVTLSERKWVILRERRRRWIALRRSPHVLDWANMPDPFRHYQGVLVLDLSADPPVPTTRAFEVLTGASGRTSTGDGPAFLSQLLFYSAAISASKRAPLTGAPYALRVNPSSGNLHPTEFHFISRGLRDWPDGLYHYIPSAHMAEQRAAGGLEIRLTGSSSPIRVCPDQHRLARGVEVSRPRISILPARHRARLAGTRARRARHRMRLLCDCRFPGR